MRNIRVALLLSDFKRFGVPITGISLGVTQLGETSTHSTFVPLNAGYVQLDWTREPTEANRIAAIKLIEAHANCSSTIARDTLVERGTGYPAKPPASDAKNFESLFPWPPPPLGEQKLADALQNGADLCEVLKAEPSLAFFDGGSIHTHPFGGHKVEFGNLVEWLRSRRAFKPASEVIKDLQKFIVAPGTPLIGILGFCGVDVQSSIELGDGFRIVPWSEVPQCYAKDKVQEAELQDPHSFVPGRFWFRPTGAVLGELFYFPKMTLPNGKCFPRGPDANIIDRDNLIAPWQKLQMIVDCVTICGPCAPMPIISAHLLPDWVPLRAPNGGGFGGFLPDVISPLHYEHRQLATVEFRETAEMYLRLDPQLIGKLRISIDRLNLAMRRFQPVDKALELGVAFESLIMDGEDGEITHKMSQRLGWLLGSTVDERLRIASCVKDLYELRSKAIHEGKVSPTAKKTKLSANLKLHTDYLLDDAIDLCAKAIRKIIALGAFPAWEKLLFGEVAQ